MRLLVQLPIQLYMRKFLREQLVFFFFGRRRLKKRSEKTEIARPKRKHFFPNDYLVFLFFTFAAPTCKEG